MPSLRCRLHFLAVGLENGEIHLFTAPAGGDLAEWTAWTVLGQDEAHVLSVTSLDFCPTQGMPEGVVRLASGSEDKSARVFDLRM
jgi:WD40 repeat protein